MKTKPFQQEYGRIPNMAFHKIVKHYAFGKGLPVLTWGHQWCAFQMYIKEAMLLN